MKKVEFITADKCSRKSISKIAGVALIIFVFMLASARTMSQVATYYNFSQSSGTYTPATSGFIDTTGSATTTPASIFATTWDDTYAIFRLPFAFTYNGTLYAAGTGRIGLDTDGWLTFSNGNPNMSGSTGSGASWVSISDQTGVYFYGTAIANGFAGFNCDLNEQTFSTITGTLTNGNNTITGVSSTANIAIGTRLSGTGITDGTIVVAFTVNTITMSANATSNGVQTITPRSAIFGFVSGTAPNRKFVIQWTQAKRYSSTGENINLQMILNEGNANPTLQTLQVVYGTCTATSATALETQVGLKGATTSDFNARTSTSTWAATTASAANTDHVRFSNTINPASGLTFTWSPCTVGPGAAGAISGTNPVCAGTSATYTLAAVAGATTYTWTYSGTGATFSATTGTPSNSISFATGATSGTLTVTPSNLCGSGTASNLAITVQAAPTASISYPAAGYCLSTVGTVAVTQTGTAGGTYTVSPSGLTINAGNGTITPSTSTAGTYTVTYSFTNGTCSNTTTTTVSILAAPVVTATATPSTVCNSGNSQLLATVTTSSNYTVSSIAYSSLTPSGSPTVLWSTTYTDDAQTAVTLPFTFTYYGTGVTTLNVSSNGYIELTSASGTYTAAQTIPSASLPNNIVALAWSDIVIDNISNPGCYVRYFVNGTSPNRIAVVEYYKGRFIGGTSAQEVSGQIRLYESDNHIEVAVTNVNDNATSRSKTLGVENSTGALGISPAGRNNAAWNVSSEAWAFFVPVTLTYTYLWTPATFLSSTSIANPVANAVTTTTAYNVKVTDNYGCFSNTGVTVTSVAPMSGTYTVGVGGNFTTLTAAVNAYNAGCIGGPIVFSLIDNSYPSETYPIVINSNAYASSTNTLTIKPASGKTPSFSGSSIVAIIKLNGADYVTIDGSNTTGGTTKNLTFTNTSTDASTSTIIWLASVAAGNGATNNTIKNCNFIGNASTTTYASVISSGATVGNVAEAANSNNTYQNNKFTKAQNAIALVGPTGNETGNIITGNTIGASSPATDKLGYSGIEIYQQANCQITNNTIVGLTSSNSSVTITGIYVDGTQNGVTISGNNISDVKHTNSLGYGANGIWLYATTTASNVNVYNNMIYDIAGYGYNGGRDYFDNGYGIVVAYGGGYNIYYNTVNLNTSQTAAGFPACINITSGVTTAASVNIKNNIFNNSQSGPSGQRYAIESSAASSVFGTIDYNFYYTPAANLGYISSNRANLAAIQTGFGQNTNSIAPGAAAVFTSATDMHILASNATNIANLKNKGNPIAGITDDYDITTRNGYTPDLGADEWVDPKYGSWVGKTSTDWLVASNWEANYVPDRGTDVFITGGYVFMPTIVTTQAVRGLTLSAPVPANTPILTLSGGTLQVYGAFTRTGGSIDGANGTLETDSTNAQTIPASLFVNNALKNLIINSSGGVSLGGTLDIYRSVTFGASGTALTTGSNLVFKSTATETAWLGNVTGKTITGTATVERYIPTGLNHSKSWQLLAAPVKGTTSLKSSWMENNASLGNIKPGYGTTFSSEVAGAVGRGWDFYTPISGGAGGPSIKSYDPATNTWLGIDNGVSLTGALALVPQQKGYMVFIRGDRSVQTVGAAAVPTVLRVSGTLYTTGANLPPVTTVAANKFASIGNPYASAIDFTQVTRAAGVDNVFYIWDPLVAGSLGYGGYQTISSVTGYLPTPGSTNYPSGVPVTTIQSGQAFLVHGTAGGNVSFTEAAKVSGSSLVLRSSVNAVNNNRQFLRLQLYRNTLAQYGAADGVVVAYDNQFADEFDKDDALKIGNSSENLGIASNGQLFSVEARKKINENDTIFYNLANLRAAAYQFRFGPENLPANKFTAYLVDRFLRTTTTVSLQDSTIIDFTITNEAGSYASDRFYLVFRKKKNIPVADPAITANRANENEVKLEWQMDDQSEVQSYILQKSDDGKTFSTLIHMNLLIDKLQSDYKHTDNHASPGDNYYRVAAISKNGDWLYSNIAKVVSVVTDPGISVYPNPVVDKKMTLAFTKQSFGTYAVRMVNSLGQVVLTQNVNISSVTTMKDITIPVSVGTGNYRLTITAPDGTITNKQIFIQQ